jgi:hypothetical protein
MIKVALKMEAASYSETVISYDVTRRHGPEDNPHIHRLENVVFLLGRLQVCPELRVLRTK